MTAPVPGLGASWPAHWLDDVSRWPHQLAAAVAHARAASPHEACGYLEATGATVALSNRAAVPQRAFEVTDVRELGALERACRRGRVVLYHSHPDGTARWSAQDAAAWESPLGPLWPVDHLVLGLTPRLAHAVLLRWDAMHGRFLEARRGPAEVPR